MYVLDPSTVEMEAKMYVDSFMHNKSGSLAEIRDVKIQAKE